ncbi:ATP synthase subunit AtpG [Mycolicibacterium phlei]|jgi:F-type H+-transporting ATPase subunit gamma|uniref:ATP synthase gamma chain n=1 Tax=Mycolicibacterium phlei DSM 43239 = CCUG 21000 TaxID=1226750 RepID=A0A5N5V243_MYCPH|nr:F0F1 ATP synthase subunit gamma [Mycolicibacterium phlei]VEG10805.1 ATP synthase subunit AtpG [Mycobacteroides chelonae]AMO62704.1 ATP synthase gamma chain [Mycolicibacterium phlei]KAB7755965.1 F0F1 ATP synthase subunit gamma [Mycolicibacterium phlei DSM 43239 = CCUG 21000]KXW65923.1 F0F1 ATP synthase subunit gamma [Mycolicibacterium phlei DSM 43239 = CCUG 21000]KXW68242.1 F0F1 ATP synthase subunit gamma [Mycolicibacterium phlei DSM 43072]
MAATLRELRGRIRSAGSIKKITKAQELIATSRIAKAQARVEAARPYATEITNMLTNLASASALDHPLLVERENPKRAAVLVVSSDRGLCGAYNANVLRRAEELVAMLRDEGKEPVLYVVGRKALGYFSFRQREVNESWTGFSERPSYEDARKIADTLVDAFMAGADDDGDDAGADGILGVDELHIVFTEFKTMLSQTAEARRIAPMVVEYVGEVEEGPHTLFSFEPDAETLFASLLPRYIATRVYAALLEAAASESAARRRAMKSASDNADDLIRALTLEANRERQAQITQEISEIVGGANALADATG